MGRTIRPSKSSMARILSASQTLMAGLVRGLDMDEDKVLGLQGVDRRPGLAFIVGVDIAGGAGDL